MDTFSSIQGLRCLNCAREYPLDPMLEGCPDCQAVKRLAILDPMYRLGPDETKALGEIGPGRLWDYHCLLPLPDQGSVVTMGEGATPLLPLSQAAQETGAEQVWVKYEAVNPTHSFKDRANSVAVSMARHFGFTKVLCTSTGNHGVALAAYAARAGLRCLVLLPPGAPPVAAQEIRFFEADVVIVDGDIIPLMTQLWREHGWYISQRNAPGVGGRPFGNPFGMEGYKAMAYEIFHQLGRRAPDKVFLPVGGGDGAWGVFKGFDELYRLGLSSQVPEIIACQSAAGAPLAHAWDESLSRVEPVATSPTIAFSIVDRQSGDHALMAVRRSGGRAVAVDDAALRAAEDLFRKAGLCVEPSSAASLAGLRELARENARPMGETVVLIATGAGLRWPATFDDVSRKPPQVAGSLSAISRVVDL